jgi:nucleoside phosphorylase/CheY-like chemotaxis protein
MKILVVEDSQSKLQRLVALLTGECAVKRDDIVVAQSATDARRAMQGAPFDLMVLDILLPLRPEDDAFKETSIELLEEIIEEELYSKPKYIVGLTAYEDAAEAVEPIFKEHTWTIVQFDDATKSWETPLRNCIDYIRRQEAAPSARAYNIDLCIVTALAHPEMSAVHRLPWNWQSDTPLDDTTFVRFGSFVSGQREHSVVTAVASRMGMIATGLLATKLIQAFAPRVIVMCGICAGVREKTRIGDIIFADPTWDWQSGKRVRDKENTQFAIAPHQLAAAEFARVRAQRLAGDAAFLAKVRADWVDPPHDALRLLVGPMASGSAVLADGQVVEEIRTQERNLLGVEMECYGLFAAAAASGAPRPTAMAFKSVCDYADPDKKDSKQPYAAFTSAAVMKEFFERYFDEISRSGGM